LKEQFQALGGTAAQGMQVCWIDPPGRTLWLNTAMEMKPGSSPLPLLVLFWLRLLKAAAAASVVAITVTHTGKRYDSELIKW